MMDEFKTACEIVGWRYHVARMTGAPSFHHPDHGYVIAEDWEEIYWTYVADPDDNWDERAQDQSESALYWHGR